MEERPLDLMTELNSFAIQYARACAYNRSEVDDFLQEILIVLLKISRRQDLARMEKNRLLKYARSAMRNRVRDLVKHNGVRAKYHVPLLDEHEETIVVDDTAAREAAAAIEVMKKSARGKMIEILDMVGAGNTVEETAMALKIQRITVYRGLKRARRLLS